MMLLHLRITFIIVTSMLLYGCTDSDAPFKMSEEREISKVISGTDNVAYITESFSHLGHITYVLIDFSDDYGLCSVASTHGVNLELSILWLSDTILEITHNPDTVLDRNELRQYIQCDSKKLLEVVLKERIIHNKSI